MEEQNFNIEIDLGGDFPLLFEADVSHKPEAVDETIQQEGNVVNFFLQLFPHLFPMNIPI